MHLNKLEHVLLQDVYDIEPLNGLYLTAMRDVEEATLDLILEALIKLIELNYLKCSFVENETSTRRQCDNVTKEDLKRHCSGRTEEELKEHPSDEYGGEWEFEITDEGRMEKEKDIYDEYYYSPEELIRIREMESRYTRTKSITIQIEDHGDEDCPDPVVFFEGHAEDLEFIGNLFFEHARAKYDWPRRLSPRGPGSLLFTPESTHGIYIHCLPCLRPPKQKCIEYSLGSEGIEYIRDRLSYGHTLAKSLMASMDFDAGKAVTFLPPGISSDRLTDFKRGDVMPIPEKSEWAYPSHDSSNKPVIITTHDDLLSNIYYFLDQVEDSICIFENFSTKASDPRLSEYDSSVLLFEEEVYHMLYGERISMGALKEVIDDAATIPEVFGIITTLPGLHNEFKSGNTITYNQLKTLAERTEIIIVGAYSRESYLIWSKIGRLNNLVKESKVIYRQTL